MLLGVLKERYPNEKRVALSPADVDRIVKKGVEVLVERGAGSRAGFPDEEYRQAGAKITTRKEVLKRSDLILSVRNLAADRENFLKEVESYRGKVVVGFLDPFGIGDMLEVLKDLRITAFALELMPRITRAQPMDALSSQATVAGYRAVLIGANLLPKMFPLLMTAAGTVLPANVFVIGAGVAGLQAIATAKRLGAVVHAYDIRPSVREQVQSLGAKFVNLGLETGSAEDRGGYAKEMGEEFYRRQRDLMREHVAKSDLVISTAVVPGKKAPVLITEDMVKGMRPGSVIVDLAAERGGNCELTQPGKTVEKYGVKIVGAVNLPSEVPYDASMMYSRNITNFLNLIIRNGDLNLDTEDEIVKETLLIREGELVSERIKEFLKGEG